MSVGEKCKYIENYRQEYDNAKLSFYCIYWKNLINES